MVGGSLAGFASADHLADTQASHRASRLGYHTANLHPMSGPLAEIPPSAIANEVVQPTVAFVPSSTRIVGTSRRHQWHIFDQDQAGRALRQR